MGIPESGRGKHGAGTSIGRTTSNCGPFRETRCSRGRVDRLSLAVTGKAMVPWPVAGCGRYGTGIRRRKLEPGDVAFGGAGTRTENENEPVPAGFSGDFVLTAAVRSMWSRHVHHPYALGTLRAVRDGAAARVCFPGGIRHRGIAGRGIRGLSRAFQRIRTQRHVSRGRSSGPSGPAAIWGSGPAKQARRRRNGEFDPDRA